VIEASGEPTEDLPAGVRETLAEAEVATMTPLEALNTLAQLKRSVDE
jgi:hypothetical protein